MKIIGISGTNGSGKDTVGHLLAERHNWLFISVTDMLRKELARRGLPFIRENTRALSTEWRRQDGPGVLIDKALVVYSQNKNKHDGLVIASLRNPGEADRVHELGGSVVWVDADPKVRYDRLQANAHARGSARAVNDLISFEQFLAEEQAEMHKSGDETTLNMSGVKDLSDIFIENSNDDIEIFKNEAEKALSTFF